MAPRFCSVSASRAAGLALLLLPAPPLAAGWSQQPAGRIVGRLVDRESRVPVAYAQLTLVGVDHRFASDSNGRFGQEGLASGRYTLQVRAIGYAPASLIVWVGRDEAREELLELDHLPYLLDPVAVVRRPSFAVERMQAFERRRAAGRGYFITEQQIQEVHPSSLGDLFRNVPGVWMACRGSGGCTVRMARSPRECRPDFVLDGFPATNSTSLDMPSVGIIGIEVYRTLSETPVEFLKAENLCGTIVIWTRSEPHER